MSATNQASALESLRGTMIKAGSAILVIWAMSWVLGRLVSPAWAIGIEWAVIFFVALTGLSLATARVGEFSITFALSTVAVAFVVLEVADMALPVDDVLVGLFGFSIAGINGWQLAAWSVVAIVIITLVDIRVTSAFRRQSGRPVAANADTVARAFQRRMARILDDWRGVAVAIGFLGVVVIQTVFGTVGDLGAQVISELAQVPLLSGFAATIAFGYTALGGNLPLVSGFPFFGTLTAGEFLFIGAALLLLGYFIREGQ